MAPPQIGCDDGELVRRVEELAAARGETPEQVVERALREYIEHGRRAPDRPDR